MDPKRPLKQQLRDRYARIATAREGGGCAPGCCVSPSPPACGAEQLGYSPQELAAIPAGAEMGLGCGNPLAMADCQPGETVLDLGCGAGVDCFLAAETVGPQGWVIGVDMTPEMITRASAHALEAGIEQVEFRLGELETLPVADASVDLIISNCVINLSPDKQQVFHEAYRVLKPGGRLALADMVAVGLIPETVREDMDYYVGCVAGAASVPQLTAMLAAAGFVDIRVEVNQSSRAMVREWFPDSSADEWVASARIRARKPPC